MVYSAKPLADRFWKKVDKSGDCWLWTASTDRKGYGKIGSGADRRTLIASRVAYELQIGPIPEGLNVLHTCDTPPCVRGSHLFLGTQLDNIHDAIHKGRFRTGSHSGEEWHKAHGKQWLARQRDELGRFV